MTDLCVPVVGLIREESKDYDVICQGQVAGRSTVGKATTIASPSWLTYTGESDLIPVRGGQLPFRRFLT